MDEDALAELMDIAGLREQQAEDVLRWHEDRIMAERETIGGQVVVRLLGFILGAPGQSRVADTRLRALGVAFAAGLNGLTGYKSMTAAANGEHCSPKSLSLIAAEAADLLKLPEGPNRRS